MEAVGGEQNSTENNEKTLTSTDTGSDVGQVFALGNLSGEEIIDPVFNHEIIRLAEITFPEDLSRPGSA